MCIYIYIYPILWFFLFVFLNETTNIFFKYKVGRNGNINYEKLANGLCRLRMFYLPRGYLYKFFLLKMFHFFSTFHLIALCCYICSGNYNVQHL